MTKHFNEEYAGFVPGLIPIPNLPGKATHFRPHLGPGGCTACGIQAGPVLSVRKASSKVNCKRCLKSKAFKKAMKVSST